MSSPPVSPQSQPDSSLNPDIGADANSATQQGARPGEYVVVARRYRPQAFAELIGQEHVGRGLTGAILSSRVGHAYLFTGARGVGKTSAARILGKALNCERGPSPIPCNVCDSCLSISAGSDVDVLEIDGASNRGIDDIRQLRQNVNIRPSRSRFKVYIIDEVHMLSKDAFNALLKTLEEPPEHVKFIFCTTEPEKIPITILSRCQRYDFAGIQSGSIAERLKQIADAEGVQAEPEALAVLARRAAGSMRDSQSLLEQLLAFGSRTITVADVHSMLGTAGVERLAELVRHLVDRDTAAALQDLDKALNEGVEIGQLLDQLLGYFRDVMAVAVGCPAESLLHTSSGDQPEVKAAAERLGLTTILAMMQILDQTISRLRYSTHGRTLAELALARIANLEDLDNLSELAAGLRSGAAASAGPASAGMSSAGTSSAGTSSAVRSTQSAMMAKKKVDLSEPDISVQPASSARTSIDGSTGHPSNGVDQHNAPVAAADDATPIALTLESAKSLWQQAVSAVDDMTADHAKLAHDLAILGPSQLSVIFAAKYNFSKAACEKPERASKLEAALAEIAGRRIGLKFSVVAEAEPEANGARRTVSPRQRKVELEKELRTRPLVQRAMQLFGAQEIAVTEKPECSKDSAT